MPFFLGNLVLMTLSEKPSCYLLRINNFSELIKITTSDSRQS